MIGTRNRFRHVSPSTLKMPPVQSRYMMLTGGIWRSLTKWFATASDAQLAELTTRKTFSGPPPAVALAGSALSASSATKQETVKRRAVKRRSRKRSAALRFIIFSPGGAALEKTESESR